MAADVGALKCRGTDGGQPVEVLAGVEVDMGAIPAVGDGVGAPAHLCEVQDAPVAPSAPELQGGRGGQLVAGQRSSMHTRQREVVVWARREEVATNACNPAKAASNNPTHIKSSQVKSSQDVDPGDISAVCMRKAGDISRAG